MPKSGRKLNLRELFDVMIYVVFATVLIPVINTQVMTIEGDSTNYSAAEILIAGLITLFILLGLVYAVVKTLL